MAKLPGNEQLFDRKGRPLSCLADINRLEAGEKESIYGGILPPRLFTMLKVSPETFRAADGKRKTFIYVNNRLEGNALTTIAAMLAESDIA